MGKITYQESSQYQNLKKTIESASKETRAFWNNSELSQEQVDILVQRSDEIMKTMREQCLYVHKDYLAAANSKDYVTLESKNPSIKFALPMEKDSKEYVTEYYPIFGNSFGPFNSEEYFLSETKVLWLLKESYIEKESWVKNDRGKHNQAKYYYKEDWETLCSDDGNPTIANVVKLSSIILSYINKNIIPFNRAVEIFNDIKYENAKFDKWNNWMRGVMNHICILEVNHFPGLAFASRDTNNGNIKEWFDKNTELIQQLIKYYSPSIVVVGGTPLYEKLYDGTWEVSKLISNIMKKEEGPQYNPLNRLGYVVDDKIIENGSTTYISSDGYNHVLPTINNGPIFVIAYHPGRDGNYTPDMAKKDGKRIKDWLDNKDKNIN